MPGFLTRRLSRILPIIEWGGSYRRSDIRGDIAAGLTVGAMLVPQAMAYAMLAGLPPEVGLYASTVPLIAYAVFGTSRQLAVGPVAIVSLITAATLAPIVAEGSASYIAAAAVLALLVGAVHLVLGLGRLGFVVNFLSHSVLIGFTAAAAIIIGFSQVKHVLGVSVPRTEHFHEAVREVLLALGDTHLTTLAIGLVSIAVLLALGRYARRAPSALIVVVGSILAVELLGLQDRGVKIVGEIPDILPGFDLPSIDASIMPALARAAIVITLVGFMESIAIAKVCARRYRYEIDPNRELVGLGVANVASGLFGGYAVTGGFSRTAVNDSAGARTPLASLITTALILLTIAFLTPLFTSLPQAALGAIIIVAVVNLIDVKQARHIVAVKRSDLIGLTIAFVATLLLGIEVGILIAVVASMLVVFARMSKPHTATLGRIPGSTSFRNVRRFSEVETTPGVRVLRMDAAMSFANATFVKRLVLDATAELTDKPRALVLDCSGINDIDATGADTMDEILTEIEESPVQLHLSNVKGPVRDVLIRAGLWDRFLKRVHATNHQAVKAILGLPVDASDYRQSGVDERGTSGQPDPLPQIHSGEGSGGEATWAELLRRHAEHAGERPHEGVPEHRPKAAILACSDARVPPSVLFGQPAGSLFMVRLAGNSATPGAVASLTYAVEALGTDLIVVLGHTGCGAVTAAFEHVANRALAPVVDPISDAIAISPDCRDADEAAIENVRCNVRRLRDDDGALGRAIAEGRLVVHGAVHDLDSGELRPVGDATEVRG
jgi:SulP family sulfate permease